MKNILLRNVFLKCPLDGYPDGEAVSQRRKWILEDISLEIPLGEVFTILGPSGSGKTSLLRLLNRLDDPTSGEIFFDGEPLGAFDPLQLRRRIGYIFQVPTMLPGTVADNLAYAADLGRSTRRRKAVDRAAMAECLRRAALSEDYLDRPAERLSVGEQQRVSIARALMTSPEVLLMDEPTSALDPTATARLLDLIRELNERNKLTIVFVTHQLEQARAVGRNTAVLINGRIAEVGPTSEVFTSPRSQATRLFLDGRLDSTEANQPEEAGK